MRQDYGLLLEHLLTRKGLVRANGDNGLMSETIVASRKSMTRRTTGSRALLIA